MSDNEKVQPYQPAKFSIKEYERLTRLHKELFAEHPMIEWAIYLAGIGGLADTLHVLWLVFKHVAH